MKGLAIAGTAAMFLVGGSILLHGLPFLQHAVEAVTAGMAGSAAMLVSLLADALTGVIAGGLVVGALE
jgi:predicted DNA repair protein MutK